MEFSPKPSQKLKIEQLGYKLTEHPALPDRGIVYGQEGRQATVYQLVREDGEEFALKVFKPRFRLPSLVGLTDKIAPFAQLPGLAVCERIVLTPQAHGDLLRLYPDLTYAVLMPWIDGVTWHDIITEQTELNPEQSLALARSFLNVLVNMEQQGLAHCDLSAPNVMITGLPDEPEVQLVDVEDIYAPGLSRPAALPAGASGYAHRTAQNGLWQPEADRFAGAVLTAEMLSWCDDRVQANAAGEHYFATEELQKDSERYRLLQTVLRERWGETASHLLERAWQSETLQDCPTLGEWLVALPSQIIVSPGPGGSKPIDVKLLLLQARNLENAGDLTGALDTYRIALAQTPVDDPLHSELAYIVTDLERRVTEQTALVQEAAQLVIAGEWSEAASVYESLLAQADDPEQQQKWREELARCREEGELATLFDDGLAAFERQDWAAARELLTAVVTRRPEYTRQGQHAAVLLARIPGQPGPALPRSRWPIWAAGMAAIVIIAMLLLGAANGGFALFAEAATETPTITLTSTRIVTTPILAIQTATATPETMVTATTTPSDISEPVTAHTVTPTHTITITPSPSPTASPTTTPTATNTPLVVAPLLLIAPQYGTYQNPFTFEWQSSPNESYQVRLRNVDSGHAITSNWIQASSWAVDLPGGQFGNWEWQVAARNGRVSELWSFVFNPFPTISPPDPPDGTSTPSDSYPIPTPPPPPGR